MLQIGCRGISDENTPERQSPRGIPSATRIIVLGDSWIPGGSILGPTTRSTHRVAPDLQLRSFIAPFPFCSYPEKLNCAGGTFAGTPNVSANRFARIGNSLISPTRP